MNTEDFDEPPSKLSKVSDGKQEGSIPNVGHKNKREKSKRKRKHRSTKEGETMSGDDANISNKTNENQSISIKESNQPANENHEGIDKNAANNENQFPSSNFSLNNEKYENFVNPEELEKLKEFRVLDEVKSNDEDSNEEESDSSDGVPEEEIEKMLDEELPEELRGVPKQKQRPFITRQKIVLEEKGVNQFEVLPLDWMMARHYSGMPIYMHRTTRVCTLSKPYFLGKGNTRRHDIPISAIPCLAYRRALEEEEKQKEIDRQIEEQIKAGTWKTNDTTKNTARCPFLQKMKGKTEKVEQETANNFSEKTTEIDKVDSTVDKDIIDPNVFKCPVLHDNKNANECNSTSKHVVKAKDTIGIIDLSDCDVTSSSQERDLTKKTDLNQITNKEQVTQSTNELENSTEIIEINPDVEPTDCEEVIDLDNVNKTTYKEQVLKSTNEQENSSEVVEINADTDIMDCKEVIYLDKSNKDTPDPERVKITIEEHNYNKHNAETNQENSSVEVPSSQGSTEHVLPIEIADKNSPSKDGISPEVSNEGNSDATPKKEGAFVGSKVKPVVLPGGIVMPPPRVETVSTSWKTQHLTPEQVNDYCKRLFKFKTVNIMHFKRWADRRKYTKARKTLQYPTLPEGTKLITIPAHVGNGTDNPSGKATKRDWVMNMNGRSYLSVFHEYVRQALEKQPEYQFKQLENAAMPYQATVYIGGMQYGVGHGASKRAAKAAAARASIRVLIPEMDAEMEPAKPQQNSEADFTFFDYVGIEDPRISEFCAATCEPSPHAILRTCLLRNFGATDKHINAHVDKLEYQKIKLTMTVGKHSATVVCKNKKIAKQRASQAILQALHPHVRSWGSLLRLYGSRSVKSCKEKKEEEQQITLLQDAARQNEPNYAVLDKLRNEMRKLRERDEAVVPIGTLLVKDDLPTHSGSNLNNVDL